MARTFTGKKMKVIRGTGNKKKPTPRGEKMFDSPVELDARETKLFMRWKKFLTDKKVWQPTFTTPLRVMIRFESITADQINSIKSADDLVQVFANKTRNISPEFSALIKSNAQYMMMQEHFGMTPKTAQQIRNIGKGDQIELPFGDNPFEASKVK